MATRCVTTSSASALALKVLAQRAIWLRLLPMRATCRVRSRSTSACATVQVRTRPTDRRTRSDSVNPAERAFACHSARSASLARIFNHRSRPAALMYRCRWEGQRGHSPSPAPAGDPRSVAPKGRRNTRGLNHGKKSRKFNQDCTICRSCHGRTIRFRRLKMAGMQE